jgi:glycerophosphoryl diester phosphodiesterase
MKILAHRGYWREPLEKNSFAAFERAWSGAYGIETDLRDLDGDIVVSHDPPQRGVFGFESLLKTYTAKGNETPLALNIKADGLQSAVAQLLARYQVKNFFVFDMSVPDSLHYLRAGLPVFLRLSEYEPRTALIDRAAGVWLDAFERDWWTLDTVRALHAQGKSVAIVSPELHGRPYEGQWQSLRLLDTDIRNALMLCTDFPEEADRFFAH